MEQREIIYIGDPMCSWCWGFAPQLDELGRRVPDVGLRVITGGLRAGPHSEPMTDRLAAFLAHEWTRIQERTGQPFDHGLLARRDWIYDTEPACRAVAVMRSIDEPRAWPLFKRLQRAFYAEGLLPLSPEVVGALVGDIGGDASKFMAAFRSEEYRRASWTDFSLARRWGVMSFPTVIARIGDQGYLLTIGYTEAQVMIDRLPEGIRESAKRPG